jgi:hypothetical protein
MSVTCWGGGGKIVVNVTENTNYIDTTKLSTLIKKTKIRKKNKDKIDIESIKNGR